MEKSREALLKESDVIRLIRSRRFVDLALKHLLDPGVRKELKAQSQFTEIDIQTYSSSPAEVKQDVDNRVHPHDTSINASALSDVLEEDCQMDDPKDDCQVSEIDIVPKQSNHSFNGLIS